MVKRRGPPLSLEEGDADMSGASATKSRPTKRPRLSTSIARPKIQPDPPDGDNEENIADDSMNQDDVEMTAPSAPQTLLHEDQAMHLADEPIEEDEPLDTATISEDSEEQNFSGDSSDSNDFVSITRAQFEFAKEKFLIADAAEVLEVDAGKKFARMHRKTRMTRWDKPVNKRMRRTKTRGIQWGLRPLSDMQDIFDDLTGNAVKLGFLDVIKDLGGRQLNVATMCSGTDSPMLALQMISHGNIFRKPSFSVCTNILQLWNVNIKQHCVLITYSVRRLCRKSALSSNVTSIRRSSSVTFVRWVTQRKASRESLFVSPKVSHS